MRHPQIWGGLIGTGGDGVAGPGQDPLTLPGATLASRWAKQLRAGAETFFPKSSRP